MAFFFHTSSIFDASVDRTGKDAVRISWKTHLKDLQVSIYHGDSPETIERSEPFLQIEGQTAVEISDQELLAVSDVFLWKERLISGILAVMRRLKDDA